jgi:hypothetical protein
MSLSRSLLFSRLLMSSTRRKSDAERKSNPQEKQRYLGKIQGANIVPNRIDYKEEKHMPAA